MKYKTLDDINSLKGKRVLLRSDLNSEVSGGKVVLSGRIEESAKTIRELLKKGARVVVLAHQSRPGKRDFIGLEQHGKLLRKYVKIKFVNDVVGAKALKEIEELKGGEALLLDNVRKLEEEFKPSKQNLLVTKLSPLFDLYVNDAFSVCHREQTSIVAFPKALESCVGRLVEKELESLEKVEGRDCLYILGGSKAEDNVLLMGRGRVITCGIFGHLCLIAMGINLGAQNKFLKKELKYLGKIGKHVRRVGTPLDLAVRVGGKRKDLDIDDFPSKYEVFDIGPKTQKIYVEMIKEAKSIFMKGTAGYCEEKKFCEGTEALLRAIARNNGFTVLGGGHLDSALRKLKISKEKFGFVSLSGGATVQYLAGKKLPGLVALAESRKR